MSDLWAFTTVPFQRNTNIDVLDIVVVEDFVLPVHLTALHSARITVYYVPNILPAHLRPH
jgi:hypothetical protein